MNTATKITFSRILLIFPTVVFYILAFELEQYNRELLITCCFLFSVVAATDLLDGIVARATHTVSDLGKFLDPIADKVIIVIMCTLICYQSKNVLGEPYALIFSICTGLVIAREMIMGVFRTLAIAKGIVLGADNWGKAKTDFLDVGVIVMIVASLEPFFYWFSQVVFWIGTALSLFSFARYLIMNKQVFAAFKVTSTIGNNSDGAETADEAKDGVANTDIDID